MVLDTLEAIAGGILILAAPGLAWCRALFPEWRISGPLAALRAVQTATLGFLMSIALTIVVGFGLTFSSNGPFPASWSDPLLEAILAGITAIGLVVAFLRGGFAHDPPTGPATEPAPGADSPEPTLRELVRLQTEARRLRHRLRAGSLSASGRSETESRLEGVNREIEELRARREEAFRG